jgi:phosphoribosylamine--glycine ligase
LYFQLHTAFQQEVRVEFMESVLIIGSGGREHALLKALLRSDRALCTYAYPGNPGMEHDGCMLVEERIDSWESLAQWAIQNEIDLTIVGPEQPLVGGIVDIFQSKGLTIFGPTKAAAQIEGSKHFAKTLMKKYGIPTAEFACFDSQQDAVAYLDKIGAPIVVKVSGLAAGKGAIVCDTRAEADAALKRIFETKEFGTAGDRVILEEKLDGEEASVFVLTDGRSYRMLPVAQDHKQAFDGDKGPNTGGMGAYAPAPLVDAVMLSTIEDTIIRPTLEAMTSEGMPYRGLLYVGVMITAQGPKVIEYNCRFGDPETQVILPLVECDLFDLMVGCARGKLNSAPLKLKTGACVAVVLASKGYPGKYETGKPIHGTDDAEHEKPNVDLYHAGTVMQNGTLVTNGGRVLSVTAWAKTLSDAIMTAYENVAIIEFDGKMYRKDIGAKGLARLRSEKQCD